MRVILDTNVLVSALLTPDGVPARLLDAWLEGRYELLTSQSQLEELRLVMRHPRVRRYVEPAIAGGLVNDLRHFAELLTELPSVEVSDDPADNFLLAMAEADRADYLATGDNRDVLALKRHGRTRIVTAKRLLELVARQAARHRRIGHDRTVAYPLNATRAALRPAAPLMPPPPCTPPPQRYRPSTGVR